MTTGNTQRIVRCASPFLISFVFSDRNGRRIARMKGQLERPKSWNDLKAGMTGKVSRNYRKSQNDRTDPCSKTLSHQAMMQTEFAACIIEHFRFRGFFCVRAASPVVGGLFGAPLGNMHYKRDVSARCVHIPYC